MAKHGSWTVIFDDNLVVKRTGEFDKASAKGYKCGGTDFWLQPKFANLHAIQFTDDNQDNDQVEFKDTRPNGNYDSSIYGDFSQFISLWDAAHLSQMQQDWDDNIIRIEDPEGSGTFREETSAEKIARIGERPTSYQS